MIIVLSMKKVHDGFKQTLDDIMIMRSVKQWLIKVVHLKAIQMFILYQLYRIHL